MPRDYRPSGGRMVAANREAAVYEARVDKCGHGRGDDRDCAVSEAEIQAQLGGPEAVAAAARANRCKCAQD